jgi:membrane protein YdbS with pleckstrin-like domain
MRILAVAAFLGTASLLASVVTFALSLRYFSSFPAVPIVAGIAVLLTGVVVVLIVNANARVRLNKRLE